MRCGAGVEPTSISPYVGYLAVVAGAEARAIPAPSDRGLDGRYDCDLHEQPRVGEVADLRET
jgi:hypothetical protein